MSNQFIEIERKFLLESFPVKFPLKKQLTTYQAYLSTEPEVRIRRSEADGRDVAHFRSNPMERWCARRSK